MNVSFLVGLIWHGQFLNMTVLIAFGGDQDSTESLRVSVLTLLVITLVVGFSTWQVFPKTMIVANLTPVSVLVVLLTGLGGIGATYWWWKHADQSR